MTKYNITEAREREAAYRSLINPKLMDELKQKILEVILIQKKYKDKKFAAGCSRDVIQTGAERLGWTLEELMEKTILAMRSCEAQVNEELASIT